MRYLGIDYGTKRVGIAITDAGGHMAFPRVVLPNDEALVETIADIARREDVIEIVLGESRDFAGKENPVMKRIHAFKEDLARATRVPVRFFPEVLSSREATRLQGDNEMNDASAAAIVLQSYLDCMHPRADDDATA